MKTTLLFTNKLFWYCWFWNAIAFKILEKWIFCCTWCLCLIKLRESFQDLLSTADMNSADENLVFSIARAPTRGHLESTDQPGVPITTFTQLDLAGTRVRLGARLQRW